MGNLIEVFGDLKDGDAVALKGTDELKEGTEVKPTLVDRQTAEKTPEPRPIYHTLAAPYVVPNIEREAEFKSSESKEYTK